VRQLKLNNTAAVQQNACVVFKRVVADDLARQTPDSSRLEIDRGLCCCCLAGFPLSANAIIVGQYKYINGSVHSHETWNGKKGAHLNSIEAATDIYIQLRYSQQRVNV
jgi:hypothetical protein